MALGAHAQNANTGGDLTMRFIKFMLAAVIAIGIVVAIAVNVPAVQDRLVDQAIRDNVDNRARLAKRSEEHTSELQSLKRISYAVICLKQKKTIIRRHTDR